MIVMTLADLCVALSRWLAAERIDVARCKDTTLTVRGRKGHK